MKNIEKNRHKWILQEDGTKICCKCQSRIQNKAGFIKYFEVDSWGVGESVNWYPRCITPNKHELKK